LFGPCGPGHLSYGPRRKLSQQFQETAELILFGPCGPGPPELRGHVAMRSLQG